MDPHLKVAFLQASRYAGFALREEQVQQLWAAPSAVARMTVGDICGHLFLVVRRIDKHLAEGSPTWSSGPGTAMIYPRVSSDEDLDLDIHRQAREDACKISGWGWTEVCDAFDARVATLDRRLTKPWPHSVLLGERAVDFREYLGSRTVELLVHVDDLRVSTHTAPSAPPAAAVDAALAHLLAAARHTHGDLTILRAFTRRERVGGGIPSIY